MQFRTREELEAHRVTISNQEALARWARGGDVRGVRLPPKERVVAVHLGGDHEATAAVGDWIVQMSARRFMVFSHADFCEMFVIS